MCVGNAPELTEEQMKMLIQQATFGTPSVLHPQQQVQQVQQHQQPLHFPTSQQQQQPQQQQQQQPFVGIQPGLLQEQQIQIIQANQKRMQQNCNKRWIILPGSPFQKSHTRGGSGGGVGSQQDTFNVNPEPPLSFRFGAGSSTSSASGRRPLSPAKIGAAAVANLATPTTPYRGSSFTASTSTRRSAAHHRHSSLPLDTSGISHRLSSVTSGPESSELNRAKDYNHH